jgi:hypothetical protein
MTKRIKKRTGSRIATPKKSKSADRQRPPALERTVAAFVRFLTTTPILRLAPELREHEVRRRLRHHLEIVEDTLRDGADVGERPARLKALNIAHALRVALEHEVTDGRLDALDQAACRFINGANAVIPVPGRQGRLEPHNRESSEKKQFLNAMETVLDVAGVPTEQRKNGRVEKRDIEGQWKALDREVNDDAAMSIAAFALHQVEAVLLRATTRPVSAEPVERGREQRAVARAVRHLIKLDNASPQNVAFVALSYYGTPWSKRKNFFKGIENEWRAEHDEMMAKYGDLIMRSKTEG